jgi:glycosyltransferase involved in cell wall biosynthesis
MDMVAARGALLVDLGTFTPFYDLNLAAALEVEGWRVDLVMPDYEFESVMPGASCRPGMAFRLFPRPRWGRFRGLRRAVKALVYLLNLIRLDRRLSRLPPSIVHFQWALLPWFDTILWGRCRRGGWKVVYTAHDPRPLAGTTPGILAGSYSRLQVRADAVVVHSEDARAELLEAGVIAERVHVIPPAPPFAPPSRPPSRTDARRALGLAAGDRVVLFFGFLKPYKGLAVLLRSMPALARSVAPVKLLIAGEVMESAAGYERLIAELDLSRDVDWRPGFVPRADVGTFFAAANVVALPYIDASSSGVLLDAYACHRPVVVSAVGGLAELVVPGQTGLVVPPNDPSALAHALAELLLDPERAARMGASGADLSRERYTWSGMAQRLDVLYSTLLRPSGTP